MAKDPLDMGKWKGLFEWSMKYQDGSRGEGGSGPQPMDAEKKEWLDKALQEFMTDFADRMKEINTSLASSSSSEGPAAATAAATAAAPAEGGTSLADKEALCDELMEIVENVDYARDLHKIGGLPTLLSLMSSPHPSLRWRAAEIAATCMANNPPVQRWFMEGGALPPLLALLCDPHPVVATKAVLGLSALVRHYDPGLEAFRLGGGLEKLLALLGCNTDPAIQHSGACGGGSSSEQQPDADQQQQQQQQRRLQRKVLALLQYALAKHPTDGFAAAEFGVVPRLQQLLSDGDSDMQTASLAVLAEVVSDPRGWAWVQQHHQGLLPCLQQLQQQQHQQQAEEVDEEEQQLVQKLVQLLQSATPPAQAAVGLRDHIDLDPYQDGRERAAPQTLDVQHGSAAGGQQQQQSHPDSAAWALTAVPKQEMR